MKQKYNNKNFDSEYISTSHLNFDSDGLRIKKPSWIRVKAPISEDFMETKRLIKDFSLNTVCEEASCPNIGECWSKKHATVMILGDICTRKCGFCNIKSGRPRKVDLEEPYRLARAISKLNLKHVVITSVDRDDLIDGGASHFNKSIMAIKSLCRAITIEVLVPDFQRKSSALKIVLDAVPDVLNHNLETIPRLYKKVRRGANYECSLDLLSESKKINSNIFTKSGIMVGLGEEIEEIEKVLDDMRRAKVDFVTIGQYLQPTNKHLPVKRFILPEEFKHLEREAYKKGFLMVSASPLTRSSYHADDDFANLKIKRNKHLNVKNDD